MILGIGADQITYPRIGPFFIAKRKHGTKILGLPGFGSLINNTSNRVITLMRPYVSHTKGQVR